MMSGKWLGVEKVDQQFLKSSVDVLFRDPTVRHRAVKKVFEPLLKNTKILWNKHINIKKKFFIIINESKIVFKAIAS